jgi:HEXXH motif-containing protein
VLLAAHAFVPVSALHARLAAAGHPIAQTAPFEARRSAVWESNSRAMATLGELAEPTAAGTRLLRDLSALHKATMFHVEHQP